VGVNWVQTKPKSQFVAVAAADPLARIASELISAWYTQGTIPHVHPKAA
jgi:hypothetical protein